jgi:hypothetical protein
MSNPLVTAGIDKISKGMGQQHSSPAPLAVPNLQDNSAQIAQAAPQMMAALLAQMRAKQQGPQQGMQVPGLTLNRRQFM